MPYLVSKTGTGGGHFIGTIDSTERLISGATDGSLEPFSKSYAEKSTTTSKYSALVMKSAHLLKILSFKNQNGGR